MGIKIQGKKIAVRIRPFSSYVVHLKGFSPGCCFALHLFESLLYIKNISFNSFDFKVECSFTLIIVCFQVIESFSLSMAPLQSPQNFIFYRFFFPNQVNQCCIFQYKPRFPPFLLHFNVNLWIYVEKTKRKRKVYEQNKLFQDFWNAKLSWLEFVMDEQRKVHQIICKVRTKIKGKEKLMAPKLDSLQKHGGERKALVAILGVCSVGEYYMNKYFFHAKNERLYATTKNETIFN